MKRFGDRRDAKKVRDIDVMHKITAHIKPLRCDSDVYINQKMDVTELVKYMEKKKVSDNDLTYFHLFVTVIAKTIYNKPLLNRFVVNKNYYDRKNVSIAFTAKANYSDEAKDILSVVDIDPSDTLDSIKNKFLSVVNKVRNNEDSGANGIISIVGKLPKFMISFIVWIVKFMDRHDLLPSSFIKDNLYYSSIIVSNLGSIKSGAIYHNLTDFGTSSILATIGEIKLEKVLVNSREEERYMCEFGINIDERIADGVYFVKAIKLMQDILNRPELLERSVNEKVEETTKFKY